MKSTCIDCGRPTVGLRCRKDNIAYQRAKALGDTALSDAILLRMVAEEKLTGPRLAARLGLTRVAAARRIRMARLRTNMRIMRDGKEVNGLTAEPVTG